MLSLIVCIALGMALFVGYRRGLVRQMGSLVGVVLALAVTRLFGDSAAEMASNALNISDSAGGQAVAAFVGRAGLFLAVWILSGLIVSFCHEALSALHLGCVNSLGGAAFMMFKVALAVGLLANCWMLAKGTSPADYPPVVNAVATLPGKVLGYFQS